MRRRTKKISLFLLFCVFCSALFVGRVFVYDTNYAHPGMTKAAGELYNNQIASNADVEDAYMHPLRRLTEKEIGWLEQGAIEEDYPPRWLNHFYDPVHNRGYLGLNESAKQWSVDPEKQAGFALGDQSWQRAIYEYQHGNKQKSFIALGHVLHLLEDMTVPAHTRDDGHPDGDPYEAWVKENWKVLDSGIIYKNTLSDYFDFLAGYSNNNFFSKDTITNQRFSQPTLTDKKEEFGYILNFDNNKFRLIGFTRDNIKRSVKYFFDDSVNSDFFSLLAPKAIGAGAGVIKLFFEEVAKNPVSRPTVLWQTSLLGYLQEPIGRMVNTAEPLIDSVKSFLTNPSDSAKQWQLVKDIFTTGVALAQETPRQIGATAISAVQEMSTETPEILRGLLGTDTPLESHLNLSADRHIWSDYAMANWIPNLTESLASQSNDKILPSFLDGFLSEPTQSTLPASTIVSPITTLTTTPTVSGGSVSVSQATPESPAITSAPITLSPASAPPASTPSAPPPLPPDTTPPDAPSIIIPTSKITWTTSTTASLELLLTSDTHSLFFNSQSETVSSSKRSTIVDLQEGANVFDFVAADLAGNKSATTSLTIYKDTIGPTSSVSIKTNATDHKNLAISWVTDDGLGSGASVVDIEYATSTSGWLAWINKTTFTIAEFVGEEGNEYQFRSRATDVLGNVGDWSNIAKVTVDLSHVVINEIAWAGTVASANDEWLELYNTSAFDADISNWILTDGDDINFVFPASTVLVRGNLYLLERTNDQPVANRASDFIYTGSLSNNGERLQLKDSKGRLIDEVDCRSKWFAGRIDYEHDSMERIDPFASGNLSTNWRVAPAMARNGADSKGNSIAGTPGRLNSSQRILNGVINQDKTISLLRDPYLLGALTVASSTILTIDPGTIILGGTGSVLTVQGRLVSRGQIESPVIFSSLADADYRGDLTTYSKYWDRIEVLSGGQAEIKNTRLLYGSASGLADKEGGVLRVDNGVLSTENLEIIKTNQEVGEYFAVRLTSASSTINHSKINFGSKGIKSVGGRLNLSSTEISEMATDALWSDGTQTILRDNQFIHNGWGYSNRPWWQRPTPLNAPVFVKNSLPEAHGNVYQSNIFDALEFAGQISASGTIDNANEPPWLVGNWQIMPGAEVTITASSCLKMVAGADLVVNGSLLAEGKSDAKIVFTSWHDDSDGFDSDTFSQAAPAQQGNEWRQIVFDSKTTSTLNNVQVHYANTVSTGSVVIKNTPVFLDNSLIRYSRPSGIGLRLQNASQAIVNNLTIKNDYKIPFDPSGYAFGSGILVDGGAPVISSSIIDSYTYGVMKQNQATPQIDDLLLNNVDVPMVIW